MLCLMMLKFGIVRTTNLKSEKKKQQQQLKMSHLSGRCPTCKAWMVAGVCGKCGKNVTKAAPIVASARETAILGEHLDDKSVITSTPKAHNSDNNTNIIDPSSSTSSSSNKEKKPYLIFILII